MASLMENLIEVLDQENAEYVTLLELSRKKTRIIIEGDIEGLTRITDEEQSVVGRINHLENRREETLVDIATVLGKEATNLKLTDVIQMMAGRPEESGMLAQLHDRLTQNLSEMVRINSQNRELITNALEMVSFDLSLIRSMNEAPETANYNKGAYQTGSKVGIAGERRFDAKQ